MADLNNLCNFELLIKKNNDKRPISLYNNFIVNNPTIKPQEVLESVYSQIKSIQRADGRNIKIVGKNLNLVKSDFLTVNKLPIDDQVPKQINTFETQCFSDTQLINITEDAEALIDTHKGMSEEFDTAFTHTSIGIKNIGASFTHDKTERDNNKLFETQEFDTTFTQTNVDDTVSFFIDRLEGDRKERDSNNLINKMDETQPSNGEELGLFELKSVNTLKDICGKVLVGNKSLAPNMMDKLSLDNHGKEVPTKDNKIASSSNKTNETIDIGLENIPIDKETADKTIDNITVVTNHTMMSNDSIRTSIEEVKEDRSLSPVLKLKSATKFKSNLVVPLEYFERFEKLAVPLIESNNHIDTCKYLINSQILKGELCLNTGENVIFNECGQLNPIIEKRSKISQNKELSINVINSNNEDSREHCSDNLKSNVNKQNYDELMANNAHTLISKTYTNGKQCDHLKDEILFSSDEENDFIYKEFQDMPLTAALDTSFGDNSDVFEETMYVGFQTASSKSIQIYADSYQKAQFILGEREDNGTDFSLTELVEVCEKKNIYNDLKIQVEDNFKFKGIKASSVINKNYDKTQIKINERYVDRDEEMIDVSKIKVSAVTHYDSTLKKPPENQNFLGFKTARSAKALDHGNNLFKDIDFEEKLYLMDQDNLENINEEPNVKDNITNFNENRPETDVDGKINDDLIIQEFENIEMSLKEKETSFSTDNKTIGFKTANNKNIDISNAAKAKIKDVFQDIDLGEINKNSEEFFPKNKKETEKLPHALLSENIGRFIGFKTASNRNINISDKALAKTKDVFQEIDTEIKTLGGFELKNSKIEVLDYNNQPSISKSTFVDDKQDIKEPEESDQDYSKDLEKAKMSNVFEGFKTASNKKVILSEQALFKSMKIFQELGGNCQNTAEELTKSKIKNISSFSGFKTANNKAIAISEESIANTKTFFEDLGTALNKKSISDEHINTNNTYEGFQTASNKSVSVAVNAQKLTKNKFQDIDGNALVIKDNTDSETTFKEFESIREVAVAKNAVEASMKLFHEFNADKPTCSFVGFKTASNKNLKVSEVALAKCRKLFDDFDDLPENNFKVNETETHRFQTANNEKVEVTKEALQQTKDLFNDIEMPEVTEKISFTGFHTASKKKVEVSKVTLEKTKVMFRDFNESELKEPLFKGFQTAGKKKVKFSEEAIKKTKAMFKDIVELEPKEPTFKGFQTASKKKVEVSKEAMALSKQIFEDIDTNSYNALDKDLNVDNHDEKLSKERFRFQTANNRSVDVSKDALSKSRRLLEDLRDTDNKLPKYDHDINNIYKEESLKLDNTVDLDNIINTQVLNNFVENFCTEDFKETPRKSKRSGSPILSCPRAKKRKKFETPYKDEKDKKVVDVIEVDKKNTCTVKVKFTEHYKKNKMYRLKDLTKFCIDKRHIDPYITNFNLENILNFNFAAHRNELTNRKISVNEIKEIFLSAVNKNLLPEGWLDNHLKLILWKLLSYENKLAGLSYLCTVQSVMDQLKYRYDKELYDAERPALRKIFERDEVSTKTLVLCVAGISKDVNVSVTNSKEVELLLTDGWYFIMATTDRMLSELVSKGRIIIGSKIVTSGAELLNCGQGIAPWEDTSAVRLKLFGNSTRPAPWDTKLGFARAAILNHLSSVRVDGGKVNRLRVFVTRVYPLLYVEKFEDGSTVTRSERLEHLHEMKCEAERELMMERIYEEVQKEFSDQESQDSEVMESGKRKYYDSGSQIAKMMKHSKDPMEFRALLTSSQVQLLQEHSCKYREKLIQAIQNRVQEQITSRNVVTLARARIAAVNDDTIEITKGMLSVWKPNDGVMELLKEGSWVEIMNVVPTAIRYSEIQITAGRQSVFKPVKCKNKVLTHLQSLKRTCFKISDVTQNPTMTTEHNEIDTVGIVILIEPSNEMFESSKNFQNVYLADADKNIISVNFWGGIKKFGFENILDIRQIVACSNLQKRAGNTRKNIPQFRVTEFSHFTKTPKNVQAREMVDDLNKKVSGLDRRKFCDDCIAIKNNYTAIRCLYNSENESPYRFHGSDYSLVRNKMFIDTPVGAQPHKNEDVNFNLTGLDFESSFQQDAEELSPKTMLKKKKVNERIAKLKRYGEPPPLCPINIINKSVNTKNSFKSPLVSINSSVATPNNVTRNSVSITNKLPEESPKTSLRESDRERSPVISTKRAYVRSVPVKLNFVNETANNLVDHFAEEFDGSPPLSLD